MTDEEKRDWLAGMFVTSADNIAANEIEALNTLIARIEAETRAAILADEERRVWMERYANCHELWGYEAARVAADRFLDRWREARAAWEARDER